VTAEACPCLFSQKRHNTGQALYVGAGNTRLSSVHADATADAYVAALDHGRDGSTYFIASDEASPIRDVAHAIASGSAAVSVLMEEAAASLDAFTAMVLALHIGLSSGKARREMGWSPAGCPVLLWDVAHDSCASAASEH